MRIPKIVEAKTMSARGLERIRQQEADERLAEKQQKHHQAKIKRNWSNQSRKLFDAASERHFKIKTQTITLPKNLLELGFQISCTSSLPIFIKSKNHLPTTAQNLLESISGFYQPSERLILRNYELLEDFESELITEIEAFANSLLSGPINNQQSSLDEYLNRHYNFKRLPLRRHAEQILTIENLIKTITAEMIEEEIEKFELEKIINFLSTTTKYYCYLNTEDDLDDEYKINKKDGSFAITWQKDWDADSNQPLSLISARGLAWVCSQNGQSLCSELASLINSAADKGEFRINLTLRSHSLSSNGYFICDLPNVDILHDITKLLGYKFEKFTKDEDEFHVEISWQTN